MGKKKAEEGRKAEESKRDMPLGLSFGMAMNERALEQFSGMKKDGKERVIARARQVSSREEMNALIRDVADGKIQ